MNSSPYILMYFFLSGYILMYLLYIIIFLTSQNVIYRLPLVIHPVQGV